jgi:hypothetical protein
MVFFNTDQQIGKELLCLSHLESETDKLYRIFYLHLQENCSFHNLQKNNFYYFLFYLI